MVYYSIVARPYTPAALFVLLSVHSWDRWLETRSNRSLSRFVITSSLAIILHLYCLFPVALLMGLTLVRVLRAQLPRREFWKAGIWISLIVIAFMGPGLPLLLEHRLNKVGAGAPVFRTLQVSYMVLCGHLSWLALVFPFLLAAGLRGLQRRDSSFGLLIVALLIFQLVVLFATRPLGTVSVWARYYYLVWPLALILAAAGVEWIGTILCGWFRRVDPGGQAVHTAFALLFLVRATHQGQFASRGDRLKSGTLIAGRGLPEDLRALAVKRGKLIRPELVIKMDQLLDLIMNGKGLDAVEVDMESESDKDSMVALIRLVNSGDPLQRQQALWSLGQLGNIEAAPIMIKALADRNLSIVRQARDSLRLISRKPYGFGLKELGQVTDIRQAAVKWEAWYRTVRKYDEFKDD